MNKPSPIRILLVDDHFFVRVGLIASFRREGDLVVVGEAGSGEEAISMFAQCKPDVTLMDGRLPDFSGAEAARKIIADSPGARIIMLTVNETEEHIYQAVQAGVRGYLPKSTSRVEMLNAIRLVHGGAIYQPPKVIARLAARRLRKPLSPREVDVLNLLARGLGNKEIAERLAISETTVKSHVRHLLGKLDAEDRAGAVFAGVERGIVQVE